MAYKATKSAMIALTQQFAIQNAEYGIRANVILPGLMDTPMAVDRRAEAWGRPREDIAVLPVAKAMRAEGDVAEPIVFYLIAHSILSIAEERVFENKGPVLANLSDEIGALEKSYGLADGETFLEGKEPPEIGGLEREYGRIYNAMIADVFSEYGEPGLGAKFRYENEEFMRLHEEGRKAWGFYFSCGSDDRALPRAVG